MQLNLEVLKGTFAVCRFKNTTPIPDWSYYGDFYSITKTKDELSVVCLQENIGSAEKIEKDWKILKVKGPVDFSLVGIVANLSKILAEGEISIFVVSTFDTDYILVKEENLEKAIELLSKAGHTLN